MARGITVYRKAGDAPLGDAPLGSEAAVREFWSAPAAALGLPLLAAVYERGFYHGIRWAGPELPRVLGELARLEEHWESVELPREVLADLRERAGCLRAAIALAEECGGFVDVQ